MIVLVCLLLVAIGCGGEGTEESVDNYMPDVNGYYPGEKDYEEDTDAIIDAMFREMFGEEPPNVEDDHPHDLEPEHLRTLVVHANRRYEEILRQARNEMNDAWAGMGKEYRLDLEIISYTSGTSAAAQERLSVELMAGQGPDLLLVSERPIWNWVRSGLFTDIYQLIDNDPNISRDDLYTNVLESLEFNGRLYVFPLSFGFEYVGINASLPQYFIDRFQQYESISMGDMLAIYVDLKAMYGHEFGHLRLGNASILAMADAALIYGMAPFIDFNRRESDLIDSRFINFLYQFQQVFTPDMLHSATISGASPMANQEIMARNSVRYMFYVELKELGPINAFFDPIVPYFTHFIPIVCEQGQLRINHMASAMSHTWQNISIPTASDTELAWEFTQHLLNSMAYPQSQAQAVRHGWGYYSFATPIKRYMFEPRMRLIIEQALDSYAHPFIGAEHSISRTQLIDDAISRLASFNEMPVTVSSFITMDNFDYDIVEQLLMGIVSAEVAAQNLQNQISLRLIE